MLQRMNERRTRRDAELTGFDGAVHAHYCALLAALHDIGKLSRSFQSLRPELWPEMLLGPCPERLPRQLKHWESTALLLNAVPVKSALAPGIGGGGLDSLLISAIAGHHGVAPRGDLAAAEPWLAANHAEIGVTCVDAAARLTDSLVGLFPEPGSLDDPRDIAGLSFAVNGLITLADWVGSDSHYFPFEDPDLPLAGYWPLAQERAERAIREKGLAPAKPVMRPSLARLSEKVAVARPMQAAAAALALPAEPQIFVIEDGTGSGKTEAALLLAARMMAQGLGEGIFLAMPTMATANAMHGRLQRAMGGLFDAPASLVLAHGKAGVARALERLATATGRSQGKEAGSEVAHWFDAWVGDSRKTAFFASAGAGTIDQAFLSVLPKKHLAMRQYALAGRILVIDEAHACDAYMGEELKTLVEMQARLGGSVIILSATLHRRVRQELVKAFATGRGLHASRMRILAESIQAEAYPLLTRWSSSGGVEEIPVVGDPSLARSVTIRRIDTRRQVVEQALAAARAGAAVAIICNAVDPAIETWEALSAQGADAERCHLFHSRFAVEDRLAIEESVQAWFGRNSTKEARASRILVATQVIEQSLDVDFDVMFSDLAPADLIVQRAGRLWRHRRDSRPAAKPVLHVLSPDPAAVTAARWLQGTLGPAAFVYDLPGVMWRTARDLIGKGWLATPDDLRSLIETAYADAIEDLPEPLRAGHQQSIGADHGKRALGRHNTIAPGDGYAALIAPATDEEVGTRLGAKSRTLRLGRRIGPMLVPFCRREGASDGLNWTLSEIGVREDWLRRFVKDNVSRADAAEITAAARALWPEWERSIPLLVVEAGGDTGNETYCGLSYDARSGLRAIPV